MSTRKILILGVNGFIGHHLSRRILNDTDWEIHGMDMQSDRVSELLPEARFHFFEGDITINKEWIEYHIKKCDTVLPLVAIATPATYVRDPLHVFELDFEANLPIVRACVRHGRRIVFPSTSEVYGMCLDDEFDSENSELVLGPINKPRWIYACAKQLMDRVIHAYGMQEGLDYTLFRPFNWIGAGLDSINTPKEGSSRVITQFLGHIVRGEPIQLVDGGTQKRAFTYIDDGVAALMKIIANPAGIATGKIYNIGNPRNNFSVRELARMMLDLALKYPEYRDTAARVRIVETSAADYYGKGYQDVQNRVPKIDNTCAELDWKPVVPMDKALAHIFDAYRGHVADARQARRMSERGEAQARGRVLRAIERGRRLAATITVFARGGRGMSERREAQARRARPRAIERGRRLAATTTVFARGGRGMSERREAQDACASRAKPRPAGRVCERGRRPTRAAAESRERAEAAPKGASASD